MARNRGNTVPLSDGNTIMDPLSEGKIAAESNMEEFLVGAGGISTFPVERLGGVWIRICTGDKKKREILCMFVVGDDVIALILKYLMG